MLGYKEIALLIFFSLFCVLTLRILLRPRREIDRQARLPLAEPPTRADDTGHFMNNPAARRDLP